VLVFFLPGIFPLSLSLGHVPPSCWLSFGPTVVIVAKAAKRRRWNCSNCNNKMAPGVGPVLRLSPRKMGKASLRHGKYFQLDLFWLCSLPFTFCFSFAFPLRFSPQLRAKFIQRKMCNVKTCRMWGRWVVGVAAAFTALAHWFPVAFPVSRRWSCPARMSFTPPSNHFAST